MMKIILILCSLSFLLTSIAIPQEEEVKVYSIQIGAYKTEKEAQEKAQKAEQEELTPVVIRKKDAWYKVRVMIFTNYEAANKKRDELRTSGKYPDCFVVREKTSREQIKEPIPLSRYQEMINKLKGQSPAARVEDLMTSATKKIDMGNYNEAMNYLGEIIVHYAGSSKINRAKINMARCLIQTEMIDTSLEKKIPYHQRRLDLEEAIKLCSEVIASTLVELEKQEAQYWLAYASRRLALYENIKDLTKAIDEFRKVIINFSATKYKAKAEKEIVAIKMELYRNKLISPDEVLQEVNIFENTYSIADNLEEVIEVKLLKRELLLLEGREMEAKEVLNDVHYLIEQFINKRPSEEINPDLLQAKIKVFFTDFSATLPAYGTPEFDQLLFIILKMLNYGAEVKNIYILRKNIICLCDLFYKSGMIGEVDGYLIPIIKNLSIDSPEIGYDIFKGYISYLLFRGCWEQAKQSVSENYKLFNNEIKVKFKTEIEELLFNFGIKIKLNEEVIPQ